MSNDIMNKGEKLSFFQLFSYKKWKIEIPIIQRDYAQGRKSAKEVRSVFLQNLYEHLASGKNLDLDFVYGSISNNGSTCFIPLDGQQRLTTLFLLHWYLSQQERQEHFRSFMVSNRKSNFSYETRTSSREFCDALVNHQINMNTLISCKVSSTIKDQNWYYGAWNIDPSIKAMLTMLDNIHDVFQYSEGFYDKLTISPTPPITFQFLNLKTQGLTDDLYIKMNARGKQLTSFENFKARFEQFIKSMPKPNREYTLAFDNKVQQVSIDKYFSHKIDTTWADLFWNYRNENEGDNYFDDELANFIRFVATNHFALQSLRPNKSESLKLLVGNEKGITHISFNQYNKMGCIDPTFVVSLVDIFDALSNGTSAIKTYLEDKFYYDEDLVFKNALKQKVIYRDRLRFHAFYQFIIRHGNGEGLLPWMRVIFNLTENHDFNDVEEYAKAETTIERLLPKAKDILSHLIVSKESMSGFPEHQVKEERIKAHLLKKSDWHDAILKIERHGYFTGQIGFVLNFSGIEGFYNEHNNCDWDHETNIKHLTDFLKYSNLATTIFGNKGLKKEISIDHIWERALLTKGDYLLSKGSNWSFLVNDDRDISWKRLLRDENRGRRILVKNLLDEIHDYSSDAKQALEQIIKNSQPTDWTRHFIKIPELYAYLGTSKFIRWEDEKRIFLLSGQRLSGEHVEYYTYSMFLLYFKNREHKPFVKTGYIKMHGNEGEAGIKLEKWEYKESSFHINVFYSPKSGKYRIKFFLANEGIYHQEVIEMLVTMKFALQEGSYSLYVKEQELMPRIKRICEELWQ